MIRTKTATYVIENGQHIKKNNRKESNTVRIIGGQWRSRKILFAVNDEIRPTPGRIRETLFNWLASCIRGASCLELYAGSGILSIEALSRGAQHITVIDRSASSVHQVRKSLQALDAGLDRYQCIQSDAFQWIQKHDRDAWDLIFLDPPFQHTKHELDLVLPLISARGLLATDGVVYIETPHEVIQSDLPDRWEILKHKKASNVHYCLCQHVTRSN